MCFAQVFPQLFPIFFVELLTCRNENIVENDYLCTMNEKLNVEEMGRMDVAAFKASEKIPLIIVLDNVRSLYNVGSVFRTADAFRISEVWLCGITATPPNVEIHKTALGAEDAVQWKYFDQTLRAVEQLKAEGCQVISIEQCRNSVMLPDFELDPNRRYALVLGNEVKGVSQEVVDASDLVIEIPQYGTKHSMNVSVTASIMMWEMVRQWNYFKP